MVLLLLLLGLLQGNEKDSSFLVAHVFGLVPIRTSYSLRPSLSLRATAVAADDDVNDDAIPIQHDDLQRPDALSSSFASLGLSTDICAVIPWEQPSLVQNLTIPAILREQQNADKNAVRSVWCEAPTGSGKTAAFVLPLLELLVQAHRNRNSNNSAGTTGIQSLILCPTRELVVQIGSVLEKLLSKTSKNNNLPKLNIVTIHGGIPLGPQLEALSSSQRINNNNNTPQQQHRRIDIVVATPGRLVDLLTRAAQDVAETRLEYKARQALKEKKELSWNDLQNLQLFETLSSTSSSSNNDNDDGSSPLKGLLGDLRYLILDEADRLLSPAFESELYDVLEVICNNHHHQSNNNKNSRSNNQGKVLAPWLFSATFPKAMEPRVDRMLRHVASQNTPRSSSSKKDTSLSLPKPIRISCVASDRQQSGSEEVSHSLQRQLDRTKVLSSSMSDEDSPVHQQSIGPASTIDLRTIRLDQPRRTQALIKLLQDNVDEWDRVLVFVGTRYSSEHVARKLGRAGIAAAELHGKLDQEARIRRLNAFSQGRTRVLLATDVASRGLDIEGLPAVVNYDLPRSTADFVHRVGRTGRAGQRGTAITFCTSTSESHLDLIEKRHLTEPVVREVLPGFEPNETEWAVQASASRTGAPGVQHSTRGLAHDRMNGGIKGKRKSKKDRLREKAAREAASK